MGNCLVLEDKVTKVVRTDGKILEYKSPMKVEEILKEFSGHAISDSILESRHLQPDSKLLAGRLYYLVPLPLPSPKPKQTRVRFANPEVEDEPEVTEEVNVVRIKLLISKHELQKLLQGGSIKDVVSQTLHEQSLRATDEPDKGWQPRLESIPEIE